MEITKTALDGILILEPRVFSDGRGRFLETWSKERYEAAGIGSVFVQDNVSYSIKGTLRGLHFQNPHGQGKLVQVYKGTVFDVAVDIRLSSPSFGKWFGVELSGDNHRQMYIPAGFAHGFCVLSDDAIFSYKCTDYYTPSCEGGIIWNDPEIGIDWPVDKPLLSDKDMAYQTISEIDEGKLPKYDGFGVE